MRGSSGILPICLSNASINIVHSFNNLGVVLDVDSKFKGHNLNVTKKVSKIITLLFRIKKYLKRALVMPLCFGIIYPNLIHCITDLVT